MADRTVTLPAADGSKSPVTAVVCKCLKVSGDKLKLCIENPRVTTGQNETIIISDPAREEEKAIRFRWKK